MMEESKLVGEKLGIAFPVSVEERMGMAEKVGPHKTSMLQDLEAGRPMEIGGLIGVIAELARQLQIATPTIDTVLALLKVRARVAGTYNA